MNATWAFNHSMVDYRPGDVALLNTQSGVISRPLDGRRCPRKCCPVVMAQEIPRDSWGIVCLRGRYYTSMPEPESLDRYDMEAIRELVFPGD